MRCRHLTTTFKALETLTSTTSSPFVFDTRKIVSSQQHSCGLDICNILPGLYMGNCPTPWHSTFAPEFVSGVKFGLSDTFAVLWTSLSSLEECSQECSR